MSESGEDYSLSGDPYMANDPGNDTYAMVLEVLSGCYNLAEMGHESNIDGGAYDFDDVKSAAWYLLQLSPATNKFDSAAIICKAFGRALNGDTTTIDGEYTYGDGWSEFYASIMRKYVNAAEVDDSNVWWPARQSLYGLSADQLKHLCAFFAQIVGSSGDSFSDVMPPQYMADDLLFPHQKDELADHATDWNTAAANGADPRWEIGSWDSFANKVNRYAKDNSWLGCLALMQFYLSSLPEYAVDNAKSFHPSFGYVNHFEGDSDFLKKALQAFNSGDPTSDDWEYVVYHVAKMTEDDRHMYARTSGYIYGVNFYTPL